MFTFEMRLEERLLRYITFGILLIIALGVLFAAAYDREMGMIAYGAIAAAFFIYVFLGYFWLVAGRSLFGVSEISVRGRVVDTEGEGIANAILYFDHPKLESTYTWTDEDGTFEEPLPPNEVVDIHFYKAQREPETQQLAPRFDGLPHLYYLEQDVELTDEDRDIGELEVPAAYHVTIQAVDEEGNGVPGAQIGVSHWRNQREMASPPAALATDEEGQLQIKGAADPGIELVGEITISVVPPDEPDLAEATVIQRTTIESAVALEVDISEEDEEE